MKNGFVLGTLLCCAALTWLPSVPVANAQEAGTAPISLRSVAGSTLVKPARRGPEGDLFSAWNPQGPKLLEPGLKILFFGQGESCDTKKNGHTLTPEPNVWLNDGEKLTGTPLPADLLLRWSPNGNSSFCSSSVKHLSGPSFVYLSPDVNRFAMFTYSGPGTSNAKAFFQPFGGSGQEGSGASENLSGSFITYRLPWSVADASIPLCSKTGKSECSLEIRTSQSVKSWGFKVSTQLQAEKGVSAQAKQQYAVKLINQSCQAGQSPDKMCQMGYLFHVAVMRPKDEERYRALKSLKATLMFDKSQGSFPVFYGPLGSSGQATTFGAGQENPLWTSIGQSTQIADFPLSDFGTRITPLQFRTGLRIIAATRLGKPLNDTTPEDVAKFFGASWSDLSKWTVLSLNVAQEVLNEDNRSSEAFIGGSIADMTISFVP